MLLWRNILGSFILLAVMAALSSCDDTWRGLKEDTGENLEKTGEAIERAGESIQGEDEAQ